MRKKSSSHSAQLSDAVGTLRQLPDAPAHLGLGEVPDGADALDERVGSHRVEDVDELLGRDVAAGDEAPQVHLDEVGEPDVVADDRPHVGCFDTGTEQSHGRQPQRLLVALGGCRRERPGDHAAHVHHVRRHHDPRDELVAEEDRALHHHVLRVQPSAVVRIVGEEDVFGRDRLAVQLDGGPHRVRGGAEVELDLPRSDDDATLGVEERARIVLRLRHDRADRRATQRRARLFADRLEPAAQHLERDGIDGLHVPTSKMRVPCGLTRIAVVSGTQTVVSVPSMSTGPRRVCPG